MIRSALHKIAVYSERIGDRLWQRNQSRSRIIDPYIGFATRDAVILRGRVLTAIRRGAATPDQSTFTNLRQMVSLFLTDEVADVELSCQGVTTRTDEEGYFTLTLPRTDLVGWADYIVAITGHEDTVICRALIPRGDADFTVISDIDDTVMQTGAYSLARNLWTSMTGNALTRKVFPDAIEFMDQMSQSGKNPVYYVSSSPWNLHYFLEQIFERNRLVRGPKFLRDLGISETQFITGTHGDHKGASIDAIVNGTDIHNVILVGDMGQHDPFVFRDAIKRHPERIKHIVLRQLGPSPDEHMRETLAEIDALGVPVLRDGSFAGFAKIILSA